MAKTTIKGKKSTITIEGSPEEVARIAAILGEGQTETKLAHKSTKGKISIMDRLSELKESKFFDKPRSTTEIKQKMSEVGFHYPSSSLTEPLQRAVRKGVLGRVKTESGVWGYAKR